MFYDNGKNNTVQWGQKLCEINKSLQFPWNIILAGSTSPGTHIIKQFIQKKVLFAQYLTNYSSEQCPVHQRIFFRIFFQLNNLLYTLALPPTA